MMKTLLLLNLLMMSSAFAMDAIVCEENCQSQLIRMDVDNEALQAQIAGSNVESTLLPGIETFFKSDSFKKQFLTDYPMVPMGFPFNLEQCQKDKARNLPVYRNVNCSDTLMCSNPSVPQEVKADLCFTLPCAMIKGAERMGECTSGALARPTMLNYPTPVKLKRMDLTPLKVNIVGKVLKGCFRVDQLEAQVGVQVEFAQEAGISYDKMGLDNLNVVLDRPREICMSAKIDLTAAKPISEVTIDPQGGNFVSDEMINKAAQGSTVQGVTGYSPAALQALKLLGLPPLARHFRPTIESAISKALASSFEAQLVTIVGKDGPKGMSTIAIPSDSIIAEMGVGNFAVKKYVDLMECSISRAQGLVLQPTNPCLNQLYPLKNRTLREADIPNLVTSAQMLSAEMNKYDHVTSDLLRSRLINMGDSLTNLRQPQIYNSFIKPIVDRITAQQSNSPLAEGINLVTRLNQGGTHTALGVSIPKICNTQAKSPHEGHSIANCPIQAYVDLEEMNRLMTEMYETGRLCHRGQGDYHPHRAANGNQVYEGNGAPKGTGCLFVIEDDKDGMRCFLNGAPKLKYDGATQGYRFEMKTKDCFRGPVAAGQGKIGGDINFDIGFVPSFCGADFCLDNGQANWNVVPGTARFALRESSFLNGIVRKKVDQKINQILKDSIRLPMNQGPLASMPLQAEGRVDKGPGYFGACLKYKDGN